MSQRFTVTAFSKSDGDRCGGEIQGEVNQLFEGDEPTTSSANRNEEAANAEVVVLKGRMLQCTGLGACLSGCRWLPPPCRMTDVCDWNFK